MRIQAETSILAFFAILPTLSFAVNFDCKHVPVEGKLFNLSPLGGPHSVFHVTKDPPITLNTTFTLDICKQLKGSECKPGTHICAVKREIHEDGNEETKAIIPIAGNYALESGRMLEPKITRLKLSDHGVEGFLVELHGGQYTSESKPRKQQAGIEFVCDHDRSGLEGEPTEERRKRDDEPQHDGEDDNTRSLQYKSYEAVDNIDVLRLRWLTKYACEDYVDDEEGKSNHWGFFTWVIVLTFLCISAYLIFGSWLNYNRYGARGWDLLPHGDTIRDIPYLMKDWSRRVVNTVQGPGSRGGYSAV